MKAQIHPKWYEDATVKCACGNEFKTGLTVATLNVDVCSSCHPFYTGQMKYLDTAGRIDAYKNKIAKANSSFVSKNDRRRLKKEQEMSEELSRPESLAELRTSFAKK